MARSKENAEQQARSKKRDGKQQAVLVGLSVAIVSVKDDQPRVLIVEREDASDAIPFGNFDPLEHRTLDSGLLKWVEEQTGLQLGYVEQLYTFGDRGRHTADIGSGPRILSVGYLALTRSDRALSAPDSRWRDWYSYFPWEDWREKKPEIIDTPILSTLGKFATVGGDGGRSSERRTRIRQCFGSKDIAWDEEKVLERYELLYEAGLAGEAQQDRGIELTVAPSLGRMMMYDHRRILATAMGRLRGKMKYRPVVFELMAPEFTLLELQRTVEAISGIRLHKQNFRRLVENQGLVEGTGHFSQRGRGRPAEQFRFRRDVLRERPSPGFRLGPRPPLKRK
jgi:hypothetical protein